MQAAGGMGAMGGMGGIDQQALQEAMLFQAMTQIEAAVDAELERTENLTEDDLATIRRNRVAEMKRKASEKQEWEHNGHGKFTKVNDQKEFFEATKKSSHTVCMFTRKGNKWGDVMKQHFELLVRRRRRRAAAASPQPLPRLCAHAQVGCYELLDPIVSEESELVAQHYDIFLHVYAATPTGDTRLGFRRFQPRRLMEDCGWDLAHSNADPNQP